MKSKKALISLLATALLAALFSASSVTANAADNSNSTAVAKFDKAITIKNIPRLSKWGYIVTVNSDSQPISVGDSYLYQCEECIAYDDVIAPGLLNAILLEALQKADS